MSAIPLLSSWLRGRERRKSQRNSLRKQPWPRRVVCPLTVERLEDRLAPNDLVMGTWWSSLRGESGGTSSTTAATDGGTTHVDAYLIASNETRGNQDGSTREEPKATERRGRDDQPSHESADDLFADLSWEEMPGSSGDGTVYGLSALSFSGAGSASGSAAGFMDATSQGSSREPRALFMPERADTTSPAFNTAGFSQSAAGTASTSPALARGVSTPQPTPAQIASANDFFNNFMLNRLMQSQIIPPGGGGGPGGSFPGFTASSWLTKLDSAFQNSGQGNSYLAPFRPVLTFDAADRVLVNIHSDSALNLATVQKAFQSQGLIVTMVTPAQNMITGYLPVAALHNAASIPHFLSGVPVYRPILRAGIVTTQGDAIMQTNLLRHKTGLNGLGVRVGVISDSANRVDSHVDNNPDKGIAESRRTGDLPPGVVVLADGPPTSTDEGRGMMEVVHDVAPGAGLFFNTGLGGPQAMARAIATLTDLAKTKVIVDDVAYPNEPFFNDGVISQAVDRAVNIKNAVYVTAAGNEGDHAWTDSWRPLGATIANVTGTFENFDPTGGTDPLQDFTLAPGETLDLTLQWDSAFLEGGSPLTNYQVGTNMDVLIVDSTGQTVIDRFNDVNVATGEAVERVHFTNSGTLGTNNFALAIIQSGGPAPHLLKWIRFDQSPAAVQYQGGPTIFGHAGARSALTVGAVPYTDPTHAESFSSRGPVTILFDSNGNRRDWVRTEPSNKGTEHGGPLQPEIRNDKPGVVAPDGISTANFPGQPAGQPLPKGQHPIFYGTSAAAAEVAGAAALLKQKWPTYLYPKMRAPIIEKLIESNTESLASSSAASFAKFVQSLAQSSGSSGIDSATGAGLVQLPKIPALPSRAGAPAGATVGPVINASKKPGGQSETAIAIDPTNPKRLFVGANDNDSANNGGTFQWGAFSTDGGLTWTGRDIGTPADGLPVGRGDPTLAWDQFGNLYYGNIDNGNNDRVNVLLSTDGGKTFKLGFSVSGSNSSNTLDQPSLAVGPGTGGVGGSVWMVAADVSSSTSPIKVWGAPVTGLGNVGAVSGPFLPPGSDPGNFGDIAVGPKGQVITFYQKNDSSKPNDVFVNTDPDGLGPLPFGSAVKVTTLAMGELNAIPAQPVRKIQTKGSLAWDRAGDKFNGRIYLSYTDAPASNTNDTNIFLQFSDDNGATWSSRIQINDDTGTNSQFQPRIAVDQKTGILAASWYDCRNDLGNGGSGDRDGIPNTDAEFYGAVSFNGGVTWSRNIQLEPLPSNAIAANGDDNTGNDYGDYTGIAFANNTFHPCWTDNSGSLNPPDVDPPEFEVATVAVQIAFAFEDRFEPNETSDHATNFGSLAKTSLKIDKLSINIHGNGLPDYDWYRWTASSAGTFTDVMNISASNGDLELHLFTLDSKGTLTEISSDTTPDGRTVRSGSMSVAQGQVILVEVKGTNSSLGIHDQGNYNMTVTLK